MQAVFQGIATAAGLMNALYRSVKASFRYTDPNAPPAFEPDPSGFSPQLVMQFWVAMSVLQTFDAFRIPYVPELRMVFLLAFLHPSTAVPIVEGVYTRAAAPAIEATLPHVVPRLKRMQRSTQKAALAALQPLVDMANGMLVPYASEEDLHMARNSLQEMLQQVRKRRRAVEVHDLSKGLVGSRAAGAIGAVVAEGASLAESRGAQGVAQGGQRRLLRQPSDRSSLEAAAQGAWSAVNGFMSMIPAARTAAKPPSVAAAPPPSIPEESGEDEGEGRGDVIPPPAVTGGSCDFGAPPSPTVSSLEGGAAGDSPYKGAQLMDDLLDVDDDEDSVPLALVGDSSDSSRETNAVGRAGGGRFSEGLPPPSSNRVAHGTGRQTVYATPGYKMRKRSSGASSAASSASPGVSPPPMPAAAAGSSDGKRGERKEDETAI